MYKVKVLCHEVHGHQFGEIFECGEELLPLVSAELLEIIEEVKPEPKPKPKARTSKKVE